jgi:protein transport protein SEC20
MHTTHTLTTALQRTEQRLRSELERSVLSTQLLQSSTSTLRQTSNAHSNLTSLLDTSRGLVTALERTDWFDRFLIFLALAVFIGTCAWIVKVRVVDRALWLGFWWVKYLYINPSISRSPQVQSAEFPAASGMGTIDGHLYDSQCREPYPCNIYAN